MGIDGGTEREVGVRAMISALAASIAIGQG